MARLFRTVLGLSIERLQEMPVRAKLGAVRWAVLLWVSMLLGCLEPRVCHADPDCPFDSVCEIGVGQDGGVCRRNAPPDGG